MNIFTSNTKTLPYIQIVFTLLVAVFVATVSQSPFMWLVSVGIYTIIGCLGISIGYHRLLTHKSFKTSKFWERLSTLAGAIGFTGSSIGWVGVHRQHHRYSDREGDPHSPDLYGAKVLVANYPFNPNKWQIRSMVTDKFHQFVHKYYFGILTLWSLFWLMFGIELLMYVVIIPAAITVWVSTINNYWTHSWGYKNFEIADNSRNHWFIALLTFGEGWHNNHHARPNAWTFQVKWWEFDMSGKIIKLIRA